MERRISDMLSGIGAVGVDIAISDVVSADRIKEMTMNKIHANKKEHRPAGKLTRMVLIAAALALVLGIGAGAYMGFSQHSDPAGVLYSFFGQDSYAKGNQIVEYESYEFEGKVYERTKINIPAWERIPLNAAVAEKYIYPHVYGVGETMSWKDYTLTLEAMVYDANIGCGLLYYIVENPNGVEGYTLQPNGEVGWPITAPWYVGFLHPEHTYVDEERTTDTKIFLCSYFVEVDEWGDFELRLGNGDRSERCEMTIELPGSGLANLSLDEGNVVVSPIGMSVDKAALGLDRYRDIDHISIRFADGSEYIVEWDDKEEFISNSAYSVTDSVTDFCRILFNSIVDIDSVTEVEIEGQVFEVR